MSIMTGRAILTRRLFERLSGTARGDGGLSQEARRREPGNFLRHAGALALTKSADSLISPKLVLSWLVTHLGASSVFVGLLVPIREAGALLPQLFIAPRLRGVARRKWPWAAGAAVQGLACLGIAAAAMGLSGNAAGAAICALLAALALARSVSSVTYPDVLGKTVGATRRGSATGLAASTASVTAIVFALVLVAGQDTRAWLVVAAVSLAAAFFLAAAWVFATMAEMPSRGGTDTTPWGQLSLLRAHPRLRRFIWVRGLLTATALAPPYLVLLGAEAGEGRLGGLGALMLASAVASFVSSYVWGRMADRSSRSVLRWSGAAGALALMGAVALSMLGVAGTWWAMPVALFALMVAYHGVRQGRVTYLVDMAPADLRPAYTAVSNTVIGVALLGSGLFGALASLGGATLTLALFAAMAGAAAWLTRTLDEVE